MGGAGSTGLQVDTPWWQSPSVVEAKFTHTPLYSSSKAGHYSRQIEYMLHQPYPIHFWVECTGCFKPIPLHQVKIIFADYVCLGKENCAAW